MSEKGVELAAGYISLSVKKDKDGFKEIEADVKGIEKTAAKSGEAAGKAINDGITSGAKKAGKAVSDELGKSAEKAGADAGKKAGDALKDGIEKSAKGTKVTLPKVDTQPAKDSIIRDIGGGIIEAARKGAKDAGVDLDKWAVEQAGNIGRKIGDAIGNSPIGDFTRSLGIDADGAADAITGLGAAIVGIKDKDLGGTLTGISQALTGIGQTDAGNALGQIAQTTSSVMDVFTQTKGAVSEVSTLFSGFASGAPGIAGGLSSIAVAAGELAGPFLAAAAAGVELGQALQKIGDEEERKAFQALNEKDRQYYLSHGLPPQAPIKPQTSPYDVPQVPPTQAQAQRGLDLVLPPALRPSGGGTAAAPGVAPAAPSGMSGTQGAVFNAMVNAGFSPNEWGPLNSIVTRESSWNPGATNPKSGAFGLFQFLGHEGDKYGAMGGYSGNPGQQAVAGMQYIKDRYGSPSNAAAFWDQHGWYDDGGVLKPGITLAQNDSGQPEIVLTQDQAKNAMQGMPGLGAGPTKDPVGPNGAAAISSVLPGLGQAPDDPAGVGLAGAPGGKDQRTQGYIPAGAGGKGTAGTSLWSGSLQLGAQAINGLIEQAGSAAATAVSAAATAGSFGAGGQAAGPASSFLIGIGTKMAERGVSYGFQLAGIAGDALTEILMPFGVPRFFQEDPSQFLPQLPGKPAAVTTGEKAQQSQDNPAAANDPNINPAGPVQPEQMPGQQVIGPSAPVATPGTGNYKPEAPAVGPGLSPGPAVPSLAPTQPVGPQAPQSGPMAQPPPQQPPSSPAMPQDWLIESGVIPTAPVGSFDSGGWLMPQGIAINQTNRPEPILNPQQFDNLQAIASQGMPQLDPKAASGYAPDYSVRIENVTVKDVNEMQREIDSRQRLQMMRFAGRP